MKKGVHLRKRLTSLFRKVTEKAIFHGLLKNAKMQDPRNSGE
jgi:hypothetical protein